MQISYLLMINDESYRTVLSVYILYLQFFCLCAFCYSEVIWDIYDWRDAVIVVFYLVNLIRKRNDK